MRLTDDEIISVLRQELDVAQGFDADVLADKRAKALDFYFGNMASPGEGRSGIVSHDVADTVHSLMAQMGDIFKGSAIQFVGKNEEDEQQAQLEADFVRSVLENNDEYATFDAAAFDALLQGNGWIRVEVEEESAVERKRYESVSVRQAELLIDQLVSEGLDIEITDQEDNGDTVSFNVKITQTDRKLVVSAVAPERMLFSPSDDQFDLQQLRLVAERRLYTVTELMEIGLSQDQANEIPDFKDDYWPGIVAREGKYYANENELGGKQDATRLKETFICYYLIDLDDSGIAERRRIHFGGQTMIDDEPANFIPYVTGSPLPVTHRIQGQGMYEIMGEIQSTKTGILRNYMDNLGVMNQSRVGYLKGEVDIDDLQDARINGAVGCDQIGAIWPLPAADIGMQAIAGLNYLDQVRTARGGASLDMQRGEMQVAESSALAAGMEYASKEKMAGLYCKNLAQTLLKNTFLLVHKTMRELMPGVVDAKINGRWVQSDPSQWEARTFARVNVGMTNSEKQAKVMALSTLIEQQTNFISNGQEGVFTDKGKLYNAMCDWIRAADIGANPEEYITDPESEEAVAAAQAASEAAQAADAKQTEQMEMQGEVLLAIEQIKSDTAKWKTEQELKWKYFDTRTDAGIKEGELVSNAVVKGAELELKAVGGSNERASAGSS